MLRSDKNRIQMFATTRNHLTQNEKLWQDIPAFAETVGTFEALCDAIKAAMGGQLEPTTGVTEARDGVRTELEDDLAFSPMPWVPTRTRPRTRNSNPRWT